MGNFCYGGQVKRWDYTGAEQKTILYPGRYKLEVFGAQGGGYAKGEITFKEKTEIFIYCGGRGQSAYGMTGGGTAYGGWNGGGNGYGELRWSRTVAGGGATDIRIKGNTLFHRIIVGGGGANSGSGGGIEGGIGFGDVHYNKKYGTYDRRGYGGTQNAGGVGGWCVSTVTSSSSETRSGSGGFGYGGSGFTGYSSTRYLNTNGGGGGWFGGGGGGSQSTNSGGVDRGAGGGSGYVLTETSFKPDGYKLGSEYYLENTEMKNGVNSDNGYCLITCITLDKFCPYISERGIEYITSTFDYDNTKPGDFVTINCKLKPGYSFDKWDGFKTHNQTEFSFIYTGPKMELWAHVIAETVKVKLKHFLYDIEYGGYKNFIEETRNYEIDTEQIIEPNNYKNYYLDGEKQKLFIDGYKQLEIEYRYERKRFKLEIETNNDSWVSSRIYTGDYRWGSKINIYINPDGSHVFIEWQNKDGSVKTKESNFNFIMPTNDVYFKAILDIKKVKYKIIRAIQKINQEFGFAIYDNEQLKEEEIREAPAGSVIKIKNDKEIKGFYIPEQYREIEQTISADGSTVFVFYYNRKYYKITTYFGVGFMNRVLKSYDDYQENNFWNMPYAIRANIIQSNPIDKIEYMVPYGAKIMLFWYGSINYNYLKEKENNEKHDPSNEYYNRHKIIFSHFMERNNKIKIYNANINKETKYSNGWGKSEAFFIMDDMEDGTELFIEPIFIKNKSNSNIYNNIIPEDTDSLTVIDMLNKGMIKITETVKQTNHGFKVNDVICFIDGKYYKAIAEDSNYGKPIGMIKYINSENSFTYAKAGFIDINDNNYTESSIMYLSDKIPGKLVPYSEIENKIYIPVGFYTDNKILINIQKGTMGEKMIPYHKYEKKFDNYEESELDEIINKSLENFDV